MKLKKILISIIFIFFIMIIVFYQRVKFIYDIASSIFSINEEAISVFNNFYDEANSNITYKDITYKTRGDKKIKLDIYESEKDLKGGSPVIVYVFGNSWMYGNKNLPPSIVPIIKALQKNGFTIISTSYELLDNSINFENQVSDIKDTIRWIYKNSEVYNFNTDSIGILSVSAGAHLSMLASFSEESEFIGDYMLQECPSKVSYIIDLFGPTSLENINLAESPKKFLTILNDKNTEELIEKYSPINYIKEGLPNMLIIHSKSDTIVPFSNSLELYYKGIDYKNNFEFLKLEESSHALENISNKEAFSFYYKIINYIYNMSGI